MENEKIKKTISEIHQNILKALEDNSGKDTWSKFWQKRIIQTLNNTNERIEKLASGRMQIFDESVEKRPFWINIMESVEKTIWTTNIASASTFGSEMTELLVIQREAIEERRVKITRVFVYDPENGVQCAKLVAIMANQMFYGIEVYAIEQKVFERNITSLPYLPATDDFMIIDDKYFYENCYHLESAAYRNTLIKDAETVKNMMTIKNQVMKVAIEVTLKNIGEFPNIL